jgi:hypothetical protein
MTSIMPGATVTAPARPLAPHELKKYYEKWLKESHEGGRKFHFSVRLKAEDRLVGFRALLDHGVESWRGTHRRC